MSRARLSTRQTTRLAAQLMSAHTSTTRVAFLCRKTVSWKEDSARMNADPTPTTMGESGVGIHASYVEIIPKRKKGQVGVRLSFKQCGEVEVRGDEK